MSKKEVYELNRIAKKKEAEIAGKQARKKSIILWSCVGAVILASVWGLYKLSTRPQDENTPVIITTAVSSDDNLAGNKDSKIILVEYSDFQCPACKAYEPLVRELLKNHGQEFLLVYRHFPLPQHRNAKDAAYAAEAAGIQGKFWEMHDMIFDKQTDWAEKNNANELFIGYAKSLGLDADKFAKDADSDTVADKVDAQYRSGIGNSVNSTPTFFLNGKKIQPRSYEEFEKLISEANG